MLYKMKNWHGIYFGGLANYKNLPNLMPPMFLISNARWCMLKTMHGVF